ncbi:glycosyltransferase [Alistipes sp.]|uniref:glycosyltransferase n=1 Tax=Alistipes sp. TaxID=1872444 RepID=UPI003AB1A385
MRQHICYIISSLCNEGPVNVLFNIIKYMDWEHFKVSIITLIPEKKTSRINDFRQFPLDIYQLATDKPLGPWGMYKALRKRVRNINPDILHAHCSRSLYLMSFLPRKYKRTYTIHNYPDHLPEILYGKYKGKIIVFLNHYFTHKCDLPIGCAENIGLMYKEKKGWEITSIPNGSSLPIWQYNETEKKSLRKEFGLKDGIKYFIFIGRFSPEKNPDKLIKAFSLLKDLKIAVIMLGDGPMWEDLNKSKGKNVLMPGFTTRVYDYLKASDYYISTSDMEGLANTLLESMSVGLPMVLSDILSHQVVINSVPNNIKLGVTINQKDTDSIATGIKAILNFDTAATADNIRQLFFQKYRAEIMSDKYQNIYTQFL